MKPEYLVSTGVVRLLTNRYGLDLSDEARSSIRTLEDQFVQRLGEELCDTFAYDIVNEDTIESTMTKSVKRKNGLPIISLDDVYFKDMPVDGRISITRLVTDVNNFDDMSMGPRKGFASLETQLESLERFKGRDVALMDVGVFSGETLLSKKNGLIRTLADVGINVRRIYVSILNEKGRARLESNGVTPITSNKIYDFTDGDWLEVRDLLSLDGRKIDCNKYAINNGTNLFARYTENPLTLAAGANIQDGVTAAIVLDLCNMYQKKILREVRKGGYQVIEGCINSDPRLYTLEFKKV